MFLLKGFYFDIKIFTAFSSISTLLLLKEYPTSHLGIPYSSPRSTLRLKKSIHKAPVYRVSVSTTPAIDQFDQFY